MESIDRSEVFIRLGLILITIEFPFHLDRLIHLSVCNEHSDRVLYAPMGTTLELKSVFLPHWGIQ